MDNQQKESSIKYKNYLINARKFFEKHSDGMIRENHYNHNLEPNFWKYMVEPVLENPNQYEDKLGFEFGCGAGRNLVNLLVAGNFLRVDGIDISKGNAVNAQNFVDVKIGLGKSIVLEGNGYTCLPFPSESYSFAISHQVFIHIPNREIRLSILKDLFRILVNDGTLVVHFKDMGSSVPYVENWNEFPMNVTVLQDDLSLIKSDFKQAGFSHVNVFEETNWVDGKLEVFVEAKKS
jgi:SAM-dependent methyltransferase